jgi:hypothetical protein
MRRPRVLILSAVGILLFLAISGVLARAFSADGAERSAITDLVQAEARGDVPGMLSRMEGCTRDAACRARVTQDAARLKRPGAVSILQLETSASFSLTSTLGNARVAFRVGESLPMVQCVRVRRAGNVLSGLRVQLLAITARLNGNASCPHTVK